MPIVDSWIARGVSRIRRSVAPPFMEPAIPDEIAHALREVIAEAGMPEQDR